MLPVCDSVLDWGAARALDMALVRVLVLVRLLMLVLVLEPA